LGPFPGQRKKRLDSFPQGLDGGRVMGISAVGKLPWRGGLPGQGNKKQQYRQQHFHDVMNFPPISPAVNPPVSRR